MEINITGDRANWVPIDGEKISALPDDTMCWWREQSLSKLVLLEVGRQLFAEALAAGALTDEQGVSYGLRVSRGGGARGG